MVYSNKFVMCVLLDGVPQQELANGVVKLPFGAEYHLRFRNKNDRRAVVKIYVDGENVSGNGYIIPANDHIDIKRHHDKDRAFKFVELDSPEAVDAGKNGPNADKTKGVIEARFYLEKEQTYKPYPMPYKYEEHHHHHHHYPPSPPPAPWPVRPYPIWCGASPQNTMGTAEYKGFESSLSDSGDTTTDFDPLERSVKLTASNTKSRGPSAGLAGGMMYRRKITTQDATKTCAPASESANYTCDSIPVLKDGCTVEGGSTGQRFSQQYINTEETYTTLKVFLQGYEDEHVEVAEAPKKGRKTNKDSKIDDLEAENERLRKELAELENAKLKEELEKAKKAKPKKSRKKKAVGEGDGDPSGK